MASNRSIPDMLLFSSVAFLIGGVFGRTKLNNPRMSEAMLAIRKVFLNKPSLTPASESQPKKLMANPATIQPIVPQTRMLEKDFSGLSSWRKDTELTSAKVGIYRIM